MKRIAVISLLALSPSLAHADSVFLKDGGEIKGEVVEQRADAVVLEVGPGRITLPMRSVARVVSNPTDLGLYHTRAATLSARDVAGWLRLAAWAQSRELATQARAAYEYVLTVDPLNAEAHLALGHVRMGDRWLSAADASRARGLVEFEGTWMSPEERQLRLEERAVAAQESRAVREADARAREAEARAREATARAEAAEADARQAQMQPADGGGIPYPWVFGPGYGPVVPGPYNPFPVLVTPRPRSGMGHGPRPPSTRPEPPPRPRSEEPGPGPFRQAPQH
ncbi:MAG TPA: hypothetical protein VIK51_23775 [Vicinamibacteria bacterium]